jgi:hypothetical protein
MPTKRSRYACSTNEDLPYLRLLGEEGPVDFVKELTLGKQFFRGQGYLKPDPPVVCSWQEYRAAEPRWVLSKVTIPHANV